MPASTTAAETNTALIAATLVHREKGYIAAIMKMLPFFWWMIKNKAYVPKTGRRLEWNLMYKLRGGDPSYQGLDIWNITDDDAVTIAYAAWKYYHEAFMMTGGQMDVENTGPEQVFDLAQQKEEAALANLRTQMNSHLYSDGTGNGGKQLTGLKALVPENPATGTIYGFNRATAGNEFMRSIIENQGASGVAVPAYTGTATTPPEYTMLTGMSRLYTKCGRLNFGKQRYPDLCLCTEDYLLAYESILNEKRTIPMANVTAADAGFLNLTYKKMTIMEDQDCPLDLTNSVYASTRYGQTGIFLNSAFIKVAYAPKRNFKVLPLNRAGINTQDALIGHILWAGEVLLTLPPKHGRHIGIAAAA